jgi:uncharacterized protein (TIGR02147 family)
MKEIYEYLDYRKYLNDYFAEQRTVTPYFSFRYAEKKVDIDASNLSKVTQGKRHIPDSSINKICTLLKLSDKDSEYFTLLVQFAKSRSQSRSREFFEKLMSFNSVAMKKIPFEKYEFYRRWYYSAVLALLYFFPAKSSDALEIGRKLSPPISENEASDAIKLLLNLNFITLDDNDKFVHTDSIITSGEQWKSIAIDSFQRETLELALRSLNNDAIEDRYISTLTVTLSDDSYDRVREITAKYRKDILKVVAESGDTNRVYQINLQLFPMSEKC